MDEKEYKQRLDEYKSMIKKKTDRELLESIAFKLKCVELDTEQIQNDLVDTYNLLIAKSSGIGEIDDNEEESDNTDSDDDYLEKEKIEKMRKEQKEQVEKMEKERKKMKDFRESFCEYCGAKLPESNFSGNGFGKCKNPKCKVNNRHF